MAHTPTVVRYQPTGWEPAEGTTESISGTSSGVSEDSGAVSVLASIAGTSAGTSVDSAAYDDGSAVEPFFSDGFESGDLTHEEGGISWGSGSSSGVSTLDARTGSNSLRFLYAGSESLDDDAQSERRYALGAAYQDVWVEYYEKIPSNYEHRAASPNNNKWFYVSDTSAEGSTGYHVRSLLEARRGNGTGGSISMARPMWGTNSSRGGLASSENGMSTVQGLVVTDDLGAWVQWRFHFRVSDVGQSNGVFRLWKNGTLFIDETGLANDAVDGTDHGYEMGYFRGWANSGFDEQTIFYIDDVKFYSEDPGWSD